MSEANLTMLILGAEFGGLVFLIGVVLVFFIFKRKRSDKEYVADFISSYKKDLPKRIEGVKGRLESSYYVVGEDADEALSKISDTETRLHKRILNLYLGNDRKCLPEIRNDVISLNERWLEVMASSLANAADVLGKTELISQMQNEHIKLENENKTLRTELNEAMKSMEEMLKEYSLLYAERDDKNENMERLAGEYNEIKERTEAKNSD